MPHLITDWAVPAIVCLLMFVVGLELRAASLLALMRRPRVVLLATLAQLIIFPAIAVTILQIFPARQDLSSAVVILSLCPGGAISNYYVYLSNRDTALSITLTTTSTLLSPISIPAMLYSISIFHDTNFAISPDLAASVLLNLLLYIVSPVVVGLLTNHFFNRSVNRWRGGLQIISLALLLVLLIATGWTFYGAIFNDLGPILGYAIAFTLGAMFVGYAASFFIDRAEKETLVIEFSVRNVAITLLVGSEFLPGATLVGFLTGYFIVEALIIVPYALWRRGRS